MVHTASPCPVAVPKNENELIKPAVDGTLAVMRACHKNKVQRVVITSSCSAIYKSKDPKKTHFTPDDWSYTDGALPYEKSKTLAEKAAWDFIADLPEHEKFEVVTINPGLVLGPNLVSCQFSSGDVVKQIMYTGVRGLPHVTMPLIDVRDVA